MKKLFTVISIFICLVSAPLQSVQASSTEPAPQESYSPVSWPDGPSIESEAAIVMELSTGTILYEKNSKETLFPASITKVMTAMLALENSGLQDTVHFSENAINTIFEMDSKATRIGIIPDEELTMEQALYGLMLASANEVANGIAEHVSGSIEAFTALMNQRATELGCVNTNFTNPHGLHDQKHYTCAYDMAVIAKAAFQDATFRKVCGTKTYTIPKTNLMDEERPLANHHDLLTGFQNASWKYEGCLGGKTGFTTPAGYTMITYARRNGMDLVSVIMKSSTAAIRNTENMKLLDYAFDNFSVHNISQLNSAPSYDDFTLFTRFSPLFNMNQSPLTVNMNANIVLPNSASLINVKQDITYESLDSLQAGPNKIGSISYSYGDTVVGSTDILYNSTEATVLGEFTQDKPDTETAGQEPTAPDTHADKEKTDLKPFIIVGILLLLLICIGLYYYFIILPHKRRRREYLERKRKRRELYKNSNDFLDL